MARTRTVKPEFWTDRRIGECSVNARLLFIATWNFADDEGGLDRSAKQLKAQAFPYDNIDCEPFIQELLDEGLLIEYEVDGNKYLHIKNFRKHQRIDKPQKARIPVYDCSKNIQPSKGMEGNGKEGKGTQSLLAATPPTRKTVPRGAITDEQFTDFKLAYPERSGDYRWKQARAGISARLSEGVPLEDILAGARRYAAYCAATGKLGSEYVMQASRFCGPERPFSLPWHPPPKAETASEAILRKLHENDGRVIEHEPQENFPALSRQ
jgi:hypothetical protein